MSEDILVESPILARPSRLILGSKIKAKYKALSFDPKEPVLRKCLRSLAIPLEIASFRIGSPYIKVSNLFLLYLFNKK